MLVCVKWEVAGPKNLNEVLSDAGGYALKLDECFKYFFVRDCQDYGVAMIKETVCL